MTGKEAEKIVNKYGKALSVDPDGIARNKSLLPCSIPRIKYAYFVYLEKLIQDNLLTEELHNVLMTTFIGLSSFIEDSEAEVVNKLLKDSKQHTLNQNDEDTLKKFVLKAYGDTELLSEFSDFVNELLPN